MKKRTQALAIIIILTIAVIPLLAPRGGVQAQVIIPTFIIPTLVLPTATRTPTPVNIGNFVWDDLDRDGRQDAGEPGIAGVTVQLWDDARTQLIDSAVTNASGSYTVTSPGPGSFRVRVVLPGMLDTFSPKDATGDDTNDSDINPSGPTLGFTDTINIAPNVISMTLIDAGIIIFRAPTATRTPTPVSIGNFIWHDVNANGIQDAGEPGFGGVTVQLWNETKTVLYGSTVSSGSGSYVLVAPQPGSYRVRVVLPGMSNSFSPKDATADDTKDSDINPVGVSLGFTDVITIASNVISMTNIDAGLTGAAPPPTPVASSTPTAPAFTPTPPQQTPMPAMELLIFLPAITR